MILATRVFRRGVILVALTGLLAQSRLPAQSSPVVAAPQESRPLLSGAETFCYREGAPERMQLFVFKPVGWSERDRRPALVFFFGGGWTHGTPERAAAWAKYAASIGLVGIVPDYRTKERFDTSPLEAVADGRAALHWVEEHATELGVARHLIIVGGTSSGGHVALWTALGSTPPGSVPREAPTAKPAALILFSAVSDTSVATGYTPFRFGENSTALSPLHQLDARMPPVLAFHGNADRTVPCRQAVALRDKLTAEGNLCELVIVPGGDHEFLRDLPGWTERAQKIIAAFLEKQGLLAPGAKR